jgi:hypothetical protein
MSLCQKRMASQFALILQPALLFWRYVITFCCNVMEKYDYVYNHRKVQT